MTQAEWPVGRTITAMRRLTAEELARDGWEDSPYPCTVLVLDDGGEIYPSQDEEGNGPGALFATGPGGQYLLLYPDYSKGS